MKGSAIALILAGLMQLAGAFAQTTPQPLEKLGEDFWNWRAKYAPFTGDDVSRIERPGFHDFVWKNGNVPIALQRWEYLGTNEK